MRALFVLALALACAALVGAVPSTANAVGPPLRVVQLGDSETRGPRSVTTFHEPHFSFDSRIESAADPADYFGLEHPGGTIQVQLIGLPADYDLALTDVAGTVLDRSTEAGKRSEQIRRELPAGRYLIAVLPKDGEFHEKLEYRLNVTVLG